jgi:hypothetical protein
VRGKPLLGFYPNTAFVFFVFAFLGQSAGPLLADGAFVRQSVSYSTVDAVSSPTSSTAGNKKIRMTCYPARTGCTKDSDCCSGHCQSFARASYCTK